MLSLMNLGALWGCYDRIDVSMDSYYAYWPTGTTDALLCHSIQSAENTIPIHIS